MAARAFRLSEGHRMPYAELHVTTHFSFLRGASSPRELFEQAKLLGLTALGIADRNSLAGIVRAYEAAKETGVRLVIGCRLDLGTTRLSSSIRRIGPPIRACAASSASARDGQGKANARFFGTTSSNGMKDFWPSSSAMRRTRCLRPILSA